MLLSILALGAVGGTVAPTPIGACRTTAVATTVTERPATSFGFPTSIISEGATDVVFRLGRHRHPLAGKTIVAEDPTMGVALLDDGSGLQFDRDCSGARCIYLGLNRTGVASACWPWLADAPYRISRKGIVEIDAKTQLVFKRPDSPSELFLRRASGDRWIEKRLLVGGERIVAIGLSPPLHGVLFSMDVIRQHRNGSMIVTTYRISPYEPAVP